MKRAASNGVSRPAKRSKQAKRVYRGRMSNRGIHRHVKTYSNSISATAGLAQNTYQAQLGFFAGAAELTTLYDQYRIDKVEVTFHLKVDPSAQTASSATWPKLWWSEDRDGEGGNLTMAQLYERSNVKMAVLDPSKPVKFVLKPNVLSATFKTTTTTGYAPRAGVWIDCSDSTVPHYGATYNIEDLQTTYTVQLIHKVFLSLRTSR